MKDVFVMVPVGSENIGKLAKITRRGKLVYVGLDFKMAFNKVSLVNSRDTFFFKIN